ncbi:MAG: hypothetical protein D3924_16440, partial [Candidatus Electrothrix sp. AR4]|nr:hypothetical protein [Candidatus Electrothrix sp. AR4]
ASSSIATLTENGPYTMENNALGDIKENPHAWNREAHIMYIDSPTNCGYSYSEAEEEERQYANNEDDVSLGLYNTLQYFLHKHPEYRHCKVYITGESYGGKYITFFSKRILEENKKLEDPNAPPPSYPSSPFHIKLLGIFINDGLYNPVLQAKFRLEYAYALGIVDKRQYGILKKRWKILQGLVGDRKWIEAYHANQKFKTDILNCGGNPMEYDIRLFADDTPFPQLEAYFTSDEVKTALNVPISQPWLCHDEKGPVTEHLVQDYMMDTSYLIQDLLDADIPDGNGKLQVLLYAGNFDYSCGIMGIEQILHDLDWERQEEWQQAIRYVWIGDGQRTKGTIKRVENLTFAVIPGAGHMVPRNQPETTRELVYHFLFGRRLTLYDPMADPRKEDE